MKVEIPTSRPTSRPTSILPYFMVIVLDIMSFWIIMPVLEPFLKSITTHVLSQYILYGIILSITSFLQILSAPIIGRLSDLYGRKKILYYCVFGSLIASIFYLLSFQYHLLSLMILARILNGLTSGSLVIAQSSIIDISHPSHKISHLASIALAMTLGLLLGPFLGGVLSDSNLISWFNNTTPFYASIILCIFCLFYMQRTLTETNPIHSQKKQDAQDVQDDSKIKHSLKTLLFHKKSLLYFTVFFCLELSWSLYFQNLPLFLSKHFSSQSIHVAFFLNFITIILSLALWIIPKWINNNFRDDLRSILFTTVFLSFIVYACIAYFPLNITFTTYLFGAIIAITVAIWYPSITSEISILFPANLQGLTMGIMFSLLSSAFAITALLSGFLNYYSDVLPFIFCAGFTAFACLLLISAVMLTSSPT